ncbi:lamin tail domain-containing protein [Halobacterium jilantaiense]|uniref:Lamin Tail Domain n=1 Tax=Halobacterium jilantaiense TaxID=355548 RepID=A0A1I0PI60_9EURY|nr:lamin tail domain-containing protein [Halobacterium jilantaiense]SEW14162.1 Lamin Tail Domain [Halobacterium jilantaiense]
MTDEPNLEAVRVVSSAEQLRPLVDRHDVSPVVDRVDDSEVVRVESEVRGDSVVSWDRFFERLDEAGQVVVYRPPLPESGDRPVFDVVSRDAVGASDGTREAPNSDAEVLATSDTGDAEPVASDGETGADSDGEADSRDSGAAAVAPARDDEHAPTAAAEGLVLDELHGAQTGTGRSLDDEYLLFENDGEQRVDLGGWVVYNEAGQSYTFPEGTTLAPGGQVTLHSDSGSDEEGHRYWGAETPVWSDRRDTVTVETAAGEAVLEVSYEV